MTPGTDIAAGGIPEAYLRSAETRPFTKYADPEAPVVPVTGRVLHAARALEGRCAAARRRSRWSAGRYRGAARLDEQPARKTIKLRAEILAMRCAAVFTGDVESRRLYVLYVTVEPCPMCAGAIVLARISGLVFGCFDPRPEACGTVYDIVRDSRLNHRCAVRSGVLGGVRRDDGVTGCQAVQAPLFMRGADVNENAVCTAPVH